MSPDSQPPESAPAAAIPDTDVTATQAKIAELEQELATARERADRFHSNWQRSAADFQNWKRRTDLEKTELSRQAEGAMTLDLVRVLDDFERAFMALPPELRSFTWIEGVYMIGQKLYALLQARGLTPIEAMGADFDPYQHEAVLREDGTEGSENLVVVQELQRGYRFHERVIRPTMVKVGLPEAEVPSTDSNDEAAKPETTGTPDEPVAS